MFLTTTYRVKDAARFALACIQVTNLNANFKSNCNAFKAQQTTHSHSRAGCMGSRDSYTHAGSVIYVCVCVCLCLCVCVCVCVCVCACV